MKRIRNLGLAAVAALALLALPSAATAAGGIEASSYPVTYTAVSVGAQEFILTGGGGATVCSQASLEGSASGPVGTLPMNVFLKCAEGGGSGSQVQMNGCKLELRPGSENKVDIGPPGCGPITGLLVAGCEVSIPAQADVPATFTNTVAGGKEIVKLKLSTTLQHTKKGCLVSGSLQYQGEWEIKGFDVDVVQVNIRTKDGFNGFFIAGKKSEIPAEQPRFEAEKLPIQISGALEPGNQFSIGTSVGTIKCAAVQFSSELTKAAPSISVGATFSNCLRGAEPATVAMNSCRFTQSVSNSGGSGIYAGKVGIACSKEGDGIVATYSNCTEKFQSQTPTSSVIYVNSGTGSARRVFAEDTVSALSYTYEAGACTIFGKNHSDGTMSARFHLYGP